MENNTGLKKTLLNAGIGAFLLLFLILFVAFTARIIYPRVITERTELESHLISNVVQVEVLNGCGVAGIASSFTNHLRNHGFDVVASGNYESFDLQESIVVFRGGDQKHARQLAEVLGIDEKNILHETSPGYYLDATVIIGNDYQTLHL